MGPHIALILAGAMAALSGSPAVSAGGSILTYHGRPDRSGHFVVRALTWDRAASLRLDEGFRARVSGDVYAQPLYWRAASADSGMLVVATEGNVVHSLDARTGEEIWKAEFGSPVPLNSLRCGNIDPLGVTGTPVIDEATETIFLDAAVNGPAGPSHLVFALSLKEGAVLPGWPVDVEAALGRQGQPFVARDQGQRGALAIFGDRVYVPFGGHYGDCGSYHGVVVGISLTDPGSVTSWATRARAGGI
jgi:outer membrane protein assembly factor BamB